MSTLAGAILIAAAIIWSFHRMSQALTDAIARLSTEVSETLVDVVAKLTEIANGTDDTAAATAIQAQADRLDEFQKTVLAPSTPTEPPPEG